MLYVVQNTLNIIQNALNVIPNTIYVIPNAVRNLTTYLKDKFSDISNSV